MKYLIIIASIMWGVFFYTNAKAHSIEEAMEYKTALTKLNDRDNQSYFLASDTDTILANVAKHHNKSVENGTYYDNHPEIDRPDF